MGRHRFTGRAPLAHFLSICAVRGMQAAVSAGGLAQLSSSHVTAAGANPHAIMAAVLLIPLVMQVAASALPSGVCSSA